jgi:hypothetical protein
MLPIKINQQAFLYSGDPDHCPQCNRKVTPNRIAEVVIGEAKSMRLAKLRLVFQCPSHQCQELFIAYYTEAKSTSHAMGLGQFNYEGVAPFITEPPTLFKGIDKVSNRFAEIYRQALAAEERGLHEVSGPGLRKALEFLIKDYCILGHPEQADKIKAMFLGDCIKTYLDNSGLRSAAERAAWLGNDELHYDRKWENKDISDLHLLVKLTLAWVETNIRTQEYTASMQPKK